MLFSRIHSFIVLLCFFLRYLGIILLEVVTELKSCFIFVDNTK